MNDVAKELKEKLPPFPKLATAPAWRYFEAFFELVQMRTVILNWEAFAMSQWPEMEEMLNSRPGFVAELLANPGDAPISERLRECHSLKAHENLLWRMHRCRIVDSFLVYLKELLMLIHRVRPETLKSSKLVTVEFVLDHPSMDEFIQSAAEQRVEELSYQGSEKLFAFLERMGIRPFENGEQRRREVTQIIEERNIIVHNRGIINQVFRKRVPWHPDPVGTQLKGNILELFVTELYLRYIVGDIDTQANEKFDIPVRKYPPSEWL